MSLPLFHCPGSFSFLDDDPDYLQMLALMLPGHWNVRLHTSVDECLGLLQQESAVWEDDAWAQQQIIDRWRQGATPLLPQVLAYWAGPARARYALTHACIVDYSMPQMNGLDALAALSDWPGLRVLLTGQADEQIAVDAFNRALIDQFLPKQDPDVAARLLTVLRHMPSNANTRASQIWRSTLTPVQNAQLRVPSTARALQQLLDQHGFVEHVVLGDPFGILGRTAAGAVGWLQLEPVSGLEELEQLAEAAGLDADALADIRHGRRLVDLELGQALGRGAVPRLQPAFPIGLDDSLIGALFMLDAAHQLPADSSYAAWLACQPERQVRR
ncbi:response regulator [Pseudorhodoferax soli]|uniref:Response regulator receiver domain-containing protein n=1 Tax=Pseudorhodoferax soli TaxID=545864 RepID=A0A368XW01_9BURK|nr:response regulator [Pseudorhodoferax soli]RCW71316.1 response regulator receiver domain-containing protein [Pseudorhodoferax soli]